MAHNETELSGGSQGSNRPGNQAASSSTEVLTSSTRSWLWGWRYLFWAIGAGLLLLAFYAEENWRGRWLWERYENQVKLKGKKSTAKSFVPSPVPDEENFAAHPLLAPLFDFVPGTQRWRNVNPRIDAVELSPAYNAAAGKVQKDARLRQNSWAAAPTDMLGWREAFQPGKARITHSKKATVGALTETEAATEVLSGLSDSDPFIEDLRAASRRPLSRFNIRYEEENPAGILLPHLAVIKRACAIVQLRASAELVLGQTARAADDINFAFYLANTFKEEPILISQLVRMAELLMILQPLAEGMTQWSETQLQTFQQQLGRFDFCADLKRTLEAEEVVFGGGFIDYILRAPNRIEMVSRLREGEQVGVSGGESLTGVLWTVAPGGWFYLERLNYGRIFDDYLLPPIDLAHRQVSPSACNRSGESIQKYLQQSSLALFFRHRYFSRMLLPSLAKTYQKAAFAQSGAELAMIACALQRYRLAEGKLPEHLDSLQPKFLASVPHDLINAQPLKYQRVSPDRYVLYSVGWNETDEQGRIDPDKINPDMTLYGSGNSEVVKASDGDWVWRPDLGN